jgi:hypothetical protein
MNWINDKNYNAAYKTEVENIKKRHQSRIDPRDIFREKLQNKLKKIHKLQENFYAFLIGYYDLSYEEFLTVPLRISNNIGYTSWYYTLFGEKVTNEITIDDWGQ